MKLPKLTSALEARAELNPQDEQLMATLSLITAFNSQAEAWRRATRASEWGFWFCLGNAVLTIVLTVIVLSYVM